MKKFISLSAAAVFTLILFSCKKEDPTPAPPMTVDEQIEYMDVAGEEALGQIDPSDFQQLADLISDMMDIDNVDLDQASQVKIIGVLSNLIVQEGKDSYVLVDFDKIKGVFTIEDGKASFNNDDSQLKLVYNADETSYSASINIKSGSKKIYLGAYNIGLSQSPAKIDVYMMVPETVAADIYCDGGLYLGTSLNIGELSLPEDLTNFSFVDFVASVSGNVFINGNNSYRLDIANLSLKNLKAEADLSLYGREASFLLSANGSALLKEKDGSLSVDQNSLILSGNVIDKVEAKYGSGSSIKFYLAKSSDPQFSIDNSNGHVTFTDGTEMEADELFTAANFPRTYTAGNVIYNQFERMFSF